MGSNQLSKIDLDTRPEAFFHAELTKQTSALPEVVEFYLVKMLSDRARSQTNAGGQNFLEVLDQPLALLYQQAEQADSPHREVELFRQVGDTSLFVCSFFRDFFRRKTYSREYFRDLGQVSYRRASDALNGRSGVHAVLTDIYDELSERFHSVVEVLSEVATGLQGYTEQEAAADQPDADRCIPKLHLVRS
jgi:hypothetical protein